MRNDELHRHELIELCDLNFAEANRELTRRAGGAVLLLALPVFLIADWPIKGWALATVLYVAVHALDPRTRGEA